SATWVVVATLVPAQSRPYIDGTTNNSAVGMVVGYNFLTRFKGLGMDATDMGSVVTSQTSPGAADAGADHPGHTGGTGSGTSAREGADSGHVAQRTGRRGPGMGNSDLKMFSPGLASQTGWLYPLAASGLVCGFAVARRRRVPRTDPALGGYLMWGVWLAA